MIRTTTSAARRRILDMIFSFYITRVLKLDSVGQRAAVLGGDPPRLAGAARPYFPQVQDYEVVGPWVRCAGCLAGSVALQYASALRRPPGSPFSRRSSGVEQLIRNQQVVGS